MQENHPKDLYKMCFKLQKEAIAHKLQKVGYRIHNRIVTPGGGTLQRKLQKLKAL